MTRRSKQWICLLGSGLWLLWAPARLVAQTEPTPEAPTPAPEVRPDAVDPTPGPGEAAPEQGPSKATPAPGQAKPAPGAAPAAPAPEAAPAAPVPEAAPAEPAPPATPTPAPGPSPAPGPAPIADKLPTPAGPEAATSEQAAVQEAGDRDDQNEPNVQDDEEDLEVLIVTGSRIKRTSFAAAAPVQVINRQDLEYSGATNLSDVVQHLSVARGSGWDGSVGSPVTTSVNLRGLGAGNTLVLLNGRRVAASAGGADIQFVDIGTIPLAAVERIEILKGGASAIYGSDAVAGVLNIITRTDWNGVRVEADAGTTDDLDRTEINTSAALGASSERARVSLALAYSRSGELVGTDRDWTDREDRISNPGYPGTFRGLLPISIPEADPDCDKAPHSRDVGRFCEFDDRQFLALIANLERASSYAHAEYDVTTHTSMFLELGVARTRGDGLFMPSLPLPPPFPTVPGDHVDNPFGESVVFIGAPVGAEAGGQRNSVSDDSLRAAVGLRGDFEELAANTLAEDWQWELFTTAGLGRYRGTIHDTLREELTQALNSCSDPTDLSGCYNPFYSSQLGTGTPNSDEVLASFDGSFTTLTDHSLQTHNAGLTGSLFELPGGDLGFALGGELRQERRSTDFDHDANAQRYGFIWSCCGRCSTAWRFRPLAGSRSTPTPTGSRPARRWASRCSQPKWWDGSVWSRSCAVCSCAAR